MPELPDVEGFRRTLDEAAGQRIARVAVADPGVLRDVPARRFVRELTGRRLGRPYRHGKWLVAPTGSPEDSEGPHGSGDSDDSSGGPTLLLHFGMTGGLVRADGDEPRHPHDRMVLVLADGSELRYRDQRKLQGLRLGGPETVGRALDGLGPDALDVAAGEFTRALAERRGRVKAVLLDQSAVAGLGNLLADEILWRSHVHPARPAREVAADAGARVHGRMRQVLRSSVRVGRVPDRESWLTGHRDEPDPHCPRCGTPLSSGRVAGRHTVWCPRCQPDSRSEGERG
ncbi:Fpg/Nei family DNA glycosylase [Actinacidiphila acididurans]|uniref:Fpg/Nei family DNA glycosylase n=1 Tax=Actinacidiphila acididurans TaxID=2784346 RepID=A0ABS2TZG7_9ACTN|nr:DNA-formamidopyrimidine glycosylase family protein [Actinacidiphila acididurans]MBM9508739.1 Fpg/Nei family DNA glycosylase [Actinacidiphila acididurans]